ncbi:MAG TPA: methyl-accepting chemotaxis protein, partial [Myxococcales bacterium]
MSAVVRPLPAVVRPLPAVVALLLSADALSGCTEAKVTPLASGWQYRWGDSPRAANDRFTWEAEAWDAPGWAPLELPQRPDPAARQDLLWMRVKLPERSDTSSQVFFLYVDQNLEAFLDGARVYAFGDLASPHVRMGRPFHLVPVGAGPAGQVLTLRIRSEHAQIGPFGVPRLASADALQVDILHRGLPAFLIGLILLGVGVLVLFVGRLLFRRDGKMVWLGVLSLASGAYGVTTVYSPVKQLVVSAPELLWYVELLSIFAVPACYFGFLTVIATERQARLARYVSWSFFAYAGGAFVLSLTGLITITDALPPYQNLVSLAILGGIVLSAMSSRGSLDAKFFLAGLAAVGAAGLWDVLMDERVVATETAMLAWGLMAFVSCLGISILLAYAREYAQRDALSERIALQNAELSEARERMVRAASEIGAEANAVIESAAKQASTSSELSASNHSTSATAAQIAQISREAARAASTVVETAEKSAALHKQGEKAVGETVAAIEALAGQAASSARSVGLLAERAEQIGTFAELAQDIAEQSNLLAINASIEAAKAGEQGKGFAVVATEMRALAEQSRQASEKIRTLLSEVLKDSQAAVEASQQGEQGAARVVDLARQAG